MADTREIDPRELNDLYLTDLMPVDALQRIQDAFSNMSGMAALTTDAKGKAVTEGSNFTEYCMELIRKNPTGCKRCEECDKTGAMVTMKTGHAATYRCHSGLVDFAAPITVQGKMIGSFIGGQVLPQAPDEEKIKAVAKDLGIDPDELWAAAQKVPVRAPEDIEMRANFLFVLAGVLSEMAYGRYMAVKAGEEIERAAHMKSDFLANMSHEIRTPMNAVIGLAEMALRENLPPLAKEYINQIKNSGRALLNIINDILDFSKIEAGKMDILPVEYETLSIINDVANMMQVKLRDKDVELLLDINPNFPAYVEGDNLRIKQVLTNIVNNAIKFTNSGHVKIRMDFSNIDDEHIKLRFFVEDTGIGIKEEDIGRLFQSFNQVDSKRNRNIEGTGLGLAISKQLLTLMGGNISVQSVYGEGSMFYFYLPQKVVDRTKAITIKEPDKKFIMCNFNTLDLKTQFIKDVARFGITHQEMENWQDVINHLEQLKENKSKEIFIFTEKKCQDDTMNEILMKYPDINMIMVEDFFMDEKSMFPNLRILKKPLSAILIAMVLNGDETMSLDGDADAYTIDFVVPDAKILLVDDNSINLTVAEGLMEPMKMKVTSVTSGKEALKRIESEQYDIIFMDHMMPELDGVETTRLIRRFHPNYDKTPIIALTANAIEGAKSMFLSEGMQDVVTKPIEVRFLAMKLKQWLPPEKIQKATEKDMEAAVAAKPSGDGTLDLNSTAIADLDTASARQLLGNDKLYLNILKKFYESIGNKAMAIKKFYDDQDIHGYTIAVHALKSEARQIGAKELSEMAAELEKAGNANDMRIIREKTAHVLKKYLTYQQDLKPFFGSDENAQDKAGIDTTTLNELFEKLAAAVDELDMDVMEEVSDKLKEYGYKGEEETLYKELIEAISEMDVDACVEIMDKWKQLR
ncbi:MAG: PocR ligand-binding domain-containing protein [Lachnospiraceae bacterium]|nr:PocR ligand-binding domain-containing protein [Lachnospiraceae bacterium]